MLDGILTAADPNDPNSLLTPAAIARARAQALQNTTEGTSSAPIRSKWQGVSNLAKALLGGYQDYKANQADATGRKAADAAYAAGVTPMGGAAASPSAFQDGASLSNGNAPAALAKGLGGDDSSTPGNSDVRPGFAGLNTTLADRTGKYLDDHPGSSLAGSGSPSITPFDFAKGQEGLRSRPDSAAIADYLQTGGQNLDPATRAWCAAFVNSSLDHAGVQGTGSDAARSFQNFGTPTAKPQHGDLAVYSRGDPNGGLGHVGFVDSTNPDGSVRLLAGNQGGGQVSTANYGNGKLLGYRHFDGAQPENMTVKIAGASQADLAKYGLQPEDDGSIGLAAGPGSSGPGSNNAPVALPGQIQRTPSGAPANAVAGPGAPSAPVASADPPVSVPGYPGRTWTRAQLDNANDNDQSAPDESELAAAQKAAGGGAVSPAASGPSSGVQPSAPAPANAVTNASAAPVQGIAPAVSAAQGVPGVQHYDRAKLTAILQNPFSTPQQQQIANALLKHELEYNPLDEQTKQLNFQKLQREVGGPGYDIGIAKDQLALKQAQQTYDQGNQSDYKTYTDAAGNVHAFDPSDPSKVVNLPGSEALPGARPMTDAERAAFKVPPGAAAYMGADGKPGVIGGGGVTVNNGAEKAEEKEIGTAKGELLAGAIKAGPVAQEQLQTLAQLSDALKSGGNNISTGPFAEAILRGKQGVQNFLGINIDGLSQSEVVKKLGFTLATQLTKEITNRPAQAEFLRALENVPGLALSPEGNKALISLKMQDAQQKIKLSEMAADANSYKEFAPLKSQFYKDNPLISPFTGEAFGAKDIQLLTNAGRLAQGQVPASPVPNSATPRTAPKSALPDPLGIR